MKHKYDVAKQALNSRSGRSIPIKDIEQYQIQEQKKDHEVMLVSSLFIHRHREARLDPFKNDVVCGKTGCYTQCDWLVLLTNQSNCL